MTATIDWKRTFGLALGVTLMLAAGGSSASAQERLRAETWGNPSGNLGMRYGTDDLNFGLGLRGGYTLDMGIYVGGMFDYFFGDSTEVAGFEAGYSAWTLMLEGGYDFGVAPNFVLRPIMGLGVLGVSADACGPGGCIDSSDTDVELELGGQVIYMIGNISIGGEARGIFGGGDALVLGLNVGAVL